MTTSSTSNLHFRFPPSALGLVSTLLPDPTPVPTFSCFDLYHSFFQLIPTLRVLVPASNSFDLDAPEARKTLIVLVCHLAILRANKQKLEQDRQRSLRDKGSLKTQHPRRASQDPRSASRSLIGSPDGVSSLCSPHSYSLVPHLVSLLDKPSLHNRGLFVPHNVCS